MPYGVSTYLWVSTYLDQDKVTSGQKILQENLIKLEKSGALTPGTAMYARLNSVKDIRPSAMLRFSEYTKENPGKVFGGILGVGTILSVATFFYARSRK